VLFFVPSKPVVNKMTLFELVKIVLDELYIEAKDLYKDKVDDVIKSKISDLAEAYGRLALPSHQPIDYKDPATRFAYVYKYVPAHGDYIFQILRLARTELGKPIFSSGDTRITCIGGGPGSDLIGVLKYIDFMSGREPTKAVTAYLLDREQAWADTWTEVNAKLDLDIKFHSVFQPLDVTRPTTWESQKKFLQADLFTLSYFVSEVMALDSDGKISQFWETLFSGAKVGAYLLYVDNGHTVFTSYFDKKWEAAGNWECIDYDDNVRFIPGGSEQASELTEYKTKIGQMSKIQGYITHRFLKKIK